MLFGNLTRDPELRVMPTGGQVASFSLATNRVYKKADGTKQEETDFHNIVVFGRQAEIVGQYLKKGSSLFVEGRIHTRSWDTPDKGKQYKTEIIVENMQFGPKSSGSTEGSFSGGSVSPSSTSRETVTQQKKPNEDVIDYPQEDINPDDIPF